METVLLEGATPLGKQLCGRYNKSFAYFTLKERIPIIITKIIDHLTRDRDAIAAEYGEGSLEDVKQVIGYLSKLKSELQTNKMMDRFNNNGEDVNKWNKVVGEQSDPRFFTTTWLFSECYTYRRIREAFQLTRCLNEFDPFRLQKDSTIEKSLEAMCLVADNLVNNVFPKDNIKEDFIRLLKMSLWGNKCDLALSPGEDVNQETNPLKMVDMWNDNLISDDCERVYEDLCKFTSNRTKDGTIDFILDNAGYELFMDLCLADYLITKKFASKIRFRVKRIPWFVSDVMMRDFGWIIERLSAITLENKIIRDGCECTLNANNMNATAVKWKKYVDDSIWTYQADEYWTLPHEYSKMSTEDPELYKSLSEAVLIFVKGDLNYRKLMGEYNWPSTTPFETALCEFFPAPLVAVRTVKADLISGLREGIMEQLNARDDAWMEKGDYGIIQYCSKRRQIN